MSLEKVPIIVQACCKLHNMCIDDFHDARPEAEVDPECVHALRGTLPECHLQSNCQDEEFLTWKKNQKKRKSQLRDVLRYELKQHNLKRPRCAVFSK